MSRTITHATLGFLALTYTVGAVGCGDEAPVFLPDSGSEVDAVEDTVDDSASDADAPDLAEDSDVADADESDAEPDGDGDADVVEDADVEPDSEVGEDPDVAVDSDAAEDSDIAEDADSTLDAESDVAEDPEVGVDADTGADADVIEDAPSDADVRPDPDTAPDAEPDAEPDSVPDAEGCEDWVGDELESALPLFPTETVTGLFSEFGDTDYFSMFTTPGSDRVYLAVEFIHEEGDLAVQILDAAGRVLGESDSGDDDELAVFIPPGFGGGLVFATVENNTAGACTAYSITWHTEPPE